VACDLTDRDTVKEYLGILPADVSKDALIDLLIPMFSAAIARFTGRNFCLTDYRDFIETVEGKILYLGQYPVTKLKRIVSCLDEIVKVKTTRDGCSAASVQKIGNFIRLFQWGSVEEDDELSIDNKTLATLKTQIEGLAGRDWQVDITSGYETHLGKDLIDSGAQPARSPDYAELFIPDYDTTLYDFTLNEETGRVELACSRFPDGRVFAEWSAGYADLDAMPEDLVGLATAIVAAGVREARSDTAMKSETKGDYSYTRFDQTNVDRWIVERYATQLARFKNGFVA